MASISDLGSEILKIGGLDKNYDIDSVDRMKYVYTNWVLIGTAVFIFAQNYGKDSVNCWANNEIKGAWEQYIETYCLIENTYFVPMNESNIPVRERRGDRRMVYYQWVPFILVGMGLFLYIPRWFWRNSQKRLKIDLPSITMNLRKMAAKIEKIDDGLPLIVMKFQEHFGNRLSMSLLLAKFFSICVILAELVILNIVLGPEYTFWGFGVLRDLLRGREWHTSGHFPRVTFCDVQVREMGNVVHNWTLQCVLKVNMFNEKVFLFLWWWLIVLLFVSIINLFSWIYRAVLRHNNTAFVKQLLDFSGYSESHTTVDYFVDDVLKRDGCMVLRLIADNATSFEAVEYVKPLWINYAKSQELQRRMTLEQQQPGPHQHEE
ncbi:unnamed protein product, partial [Mesorhabditis belari]|uniref:Innexin n=1 Tax=Mesorhabditis belari TaxID=2138241 RepID=A0AAF3EDA2_9BILA